MRELLRAVPSRRRAGAVAQHLGEIDEQLSSATMISAAEIGITDWTTLIGIDGRLTRAQSVARIGRIDAPTQPSSTKNAMTTAARRC